MLIYRPPQTNSNNNNNNNLSIVIFFLWVSVSLTGKDSNSCIRDLGFNPRLHKKLIGILV